MCGLYGKNLCILALVFILINWCASLPKTACSSWIKQKKNFFKGDQVAQIFWTHRESDLEVTFRGQQSTSCCRAAGGHILGAHTGVSQTVEHSAK